MQKYDEESWIANRELAFKGRSFYSLQSGAIDLFITPADASYNGSCERPNK